MNNQERKEKRYQRRKAKRLAKKEKFLNSLPSFLTLVLMFVWKFLELQNGYRNPFSRFSVNGFGLPLSQTVFRFNFFFRLFFLVL